MLRLLPLLIISLFGLAAASTDSTSIVDLGYAKYQGTFNATTNQTQFLSIRYAVSRSNPHVYFDHSSYNP